MIVFMIKVLRVMLSLDKGMKYCSESENLPLLKIFILLTL